MVVSQPQPPGFLFSAADLTSWLSRPVTDGRAAIAEVVVWGWLRPVLQVVEPPDQVSPELQSAAIELGGIAVVNPEGLSSYSLGSETSSYSSERRDEILQTLANGGVPTAGVAPPQGSFPPVTDYPPLI